MGMSLPFYRLLSPDDLEHIDQTGRRILESVGIQLDTDAFLDTLEKAGARVDRENLRVLRSLVE